MILIDYTPCVDLAHRLQWWLRETERTNAGVSQKNGMRGSRMITKASAIIKKLGGYLMVELFVPGGTLVILGLLLAGGSFPTVQERVLGMLPKNLSARIRPENSGGVQRKEPPVSSVNLDVATR